jgi:hypothetical protein
LNPALTLLFQFERVTPTSSKSSLVAIIAMTEIMTINTPVKKLPPRVLTSQRVRALTPGSIIDVNMKAEKTTDASKMDLPFIPEA